MTALARAMRRATGGRLKIERRRQLPLDFTEADVAKAVAEVVGALREQAGDVPRLRVIPPASPRAGAC